MEFSFFEILLCFYDILQAITTFCKQNVKSKNTRNFIFCAFIMFHKNIINVNKDLESYIKENLILETLFQI